MREDKLFLTYNQQMKKLRNDKHIFCEGSSNKKLLVRTGYFNLVNGYKGPFICDTDNKGNHIYIPGTTLTQIYEVKTFDDLLRSFLLRYITQVEEEVRTLVGYKFDECNEKGKVPWFNPEAFDPRQQLQKKMTVISQAYKEISESKLDYIQFYMKNHEQIPTWIMIKAINFSTFINILQVCKIDVSHSICELYGLEDENGKPNVKLLIGSLHWMRTIRNSCAHNERIYCISRNSDSQKNRGRIIEQYFSELGHGYRNNLDQKIMDLIIFFKYYLPSPEYKQFIKKLKDMLIDLQSKIHPNAFEYVRGHMGIKRIEDLDKLMGLPAKEIDYNKFDTL